MTLADIKTKKVMEIYPFIVKNAVSILFKLL